MQKWGDYERSAERGPVSLGLRIMAGFAILVVVGGCVGGAIGVVFSWFGQTSAVVQEQVGPRELLRKYEWFKDAAAQLDKKKADIAVYESRTKDLEKAYAGVKRDKWTREDQQQQSQWMAEVAGVKASYNQLASEYNAAMAKMNWRFCNIGDVPAGGQPLPREFRVYEGG